MSLTARPPSPWSLLALVVAVTGIVTGLVPASPLPASAAGVVVGTSSSGSGLSRSAITISRPSGTQAGHVLMAAVAVNDDDPLTAPAGWTLVRQDAIVDAVRLAVYWRVATAAEPPSYTWTLPSARRVAGGITTYTGVDITAPVAVHGGRVNTTSSTALPAPSVTTPENDMLLVDFAAVSAEASLGPPPGMTERWEAAGPNSTSTRDVAVSSSDEVRSLAGPIGTRTFSASAPGRSVTAAVALRSSGPPPPPDTDPPSTQIVSGPSGPMPTATAMFSFTADETATFECQRDGAAFESCSSPLTYTNLANGEHSFTARATDRSGNVDPDPPTRIWTVNVVTPPPGLDPYTPIGNFPYSEGSGLVASRRYPGVVWALRDGGTGQRNMLYALLIQNGALRRFPTGETFKAFPVPNSTNQDWEDLAIDDDGYLYIGDIGNNSVSRTNLVVYKVTEPDPYGAGSSTLISSYPFRYPAGNYDAESLFFYGGTLYIINKVAPPTPHTVFRFDALTPGVRTTLTRLGSVAEPPNGGFRDGGERVTGADVTPDGQSLILVTGYRAYVYALTGTLPEAARVADQLSRPPVWSVTHYQSGSKDQVEGVAFLAGRSVMTLSESSGRIRYIERRLYESALPDLTPPDTMIDSGPAGAVTTASVTFAFSSTEQGSRFECRLDGGTFAACSSPLIYDGLLDGPHTFEVYAVDAAGNADTDPASRTFTIEPATPVL